VTFKTQFFLKILRKAKHGTLEIEFPNGKSECFGEGEPRIRIQVRTWKAFDLLLTKGDLGLAETVMEGDLIVDDLATLVQWACQNDEDLGQAIHGKWYGTLIAMMKHRLNKNSREKAKKNIMAHYDLGNEFYKLWLDPSMSYSSAIFSSPNLELNQAQMNKYDRIIDSLQIKQNDHILEIGCGWGGFFSRAVERTGCRVTAVMNSPGQAQHNQERILSLGLCGHVNLKQMDYRDIEGSFDKVISIEMIEAVGEKYWGHFFAKVSASLKNRGQALIQGITIRDDLFNNYRKNTDFIQQYIFPGGMLLTNSAFRNESAKAGMNLTHQFEFGLCYAETLKQWRLRFHEAKIEILNLGFDEKFFRLWDLYLSYCEGAFRAGRINVGQYLIES
jgi:cyclopropane-fatty-acyl-phospholipid synthase